MSIALGYLFNSKESGVQTYLGISILLLEFLFLSLMPNSICAANRLFSFPDEDVDNYLPQLLQMYLAMPDLSVHLHAYLEHRCRRSVEFSVLAAWLLESCVPEELDLSTVPSSNSPFRLRNMIINEQLRLFFLNRN